MAPLADEIKFKPMRTPTFRTIKDMEKFFYGKGSFVVRKSDAPFLSTTTGFWIATYGRKVWISQSLKANALGIFAKTPYQELGFRVTTALPNSGAVGGGVAEDATLPDTIKAESTEVKVEPKWIAHNFNATEKAQFMSELPGGIGDLMAWNRKMTADWHNKAMNKMLFISGGIVTSQSTYLESLDRIVASYDEKANAYEADQSSSFSTNDLDPYNSSFNRDGGASVFDSVVSHQSKGGLKTLDLPLIDDVFRGIRANGGEPKVIITGSKTAERIGQLVSDRARWVGGEVKVTPSVNGIQGVPGTEGGFTVSTYRRVPIIEDEDTLEDTGGLPRIYVLDTDYIKFQVARPTQYFESGISNGDPYALNAFADEGMFRTAMELVCTDFGKQGKVRDIK